MAQENLVSEEEYNQLVLRINELMADLEERVEPQIWESFIELLRSLDLLHREALQRLLQLVEQKAPHLFGSLLADPVIQTLLLLYEFAPEPALPETESGSGEGFVPLNQLGVPVWVPAAKIGEFPEGKLEAKTVNGERIVLCAVEDSVYALRNACLDSILPLQMGKLEGSILTCPWHGCRYDVRSGELLDSERKIRTFPVQVAADGTIRIGFNIGAALQ